MRVRLFSAFQQHYDEAPHPHTFGRSGVSFLARFKDFCQASRRLTWEVEEQLQTGYPYFCDSGQQRTGPIRHNHCERANWLITPRHINESILEQLLDTVKRASGIEAALKIRHQGKSLKPRSLVRGRLYQGRNYVPKIESCHQSCA